MTFPRFSLSLVLLLCLGNVAPSQARAQQTGPAATDSSAPAPSGAEKAEETGDDVFRHSPAVKMMGGWFHMDEETASRTFEYLNFAVLAGAVIFGLLKILPRTFRENRANIQRQLVEARGATQQATERLAAIEQRLARLDEEIAGISKQAEKDSLEDEARIKASIEAERVRIVDAATKDIAAAGGAAQRELKRFAAGLAVDRAIHRVSLTDAEDRSLVQAFIQDFAKSLSPERGKN